MKLLAVLLVLGLVATCRVAGHRGGDGHGSRKNQACYDLLRPSNATLFKAIQDLAANQTLFNLSLQDMPMHKAIMSVIDTIILRNATVIGANNLIDQTQATTYLTNLLNEKFPTNQTLKDTVLGRVAACVTDANAQTSVFKRACTFRKCICEGSRDRMDSSEG
ncbi:uncharacterized protein [Macrobrachium rosenbergii]|uniref:uncharacterized protein n=1 Tax=Macrobrachium rosenbergii TaxID=79674 RepID=UPI0034D7371B